MELNEKEREEQEKAAVKDQPAIPLIETLDKTIQGALDLTTEMIILLHHGRAFYTKSKTALNEGNWEESNKLRAEGTQYFKKVEKLFRKGLK